MVSREKITRFASIIISSLLFLLMATPLFASEADLAIPDLTPHQNNLLMVGFLICFLGMVFGLYEYIKVKALPAHKSMLDVSEIIFQTCKTYLTPAREAPDRSGNFYRGVHRLLLWILAAVCPNAGFC